PFVESPIRQAGSSEHREDAHDLHSGTNHAIHLPVPKRGTELTVIQKPVMQSRASFRKKEGREERERYLWKDRHENADERDREGNPSSDDPPSPLLFGLARMSLYALHWRVSHSNIPRKTGTGVFPIVA